MSAKIDLENSYELKFEKIGDDNGSLVALEELRNIPFSIKRVYYIFGTKSGVVRGKHAHTKLNQVLIAVSGSCKVRNYDGQFEETYVLDSPTKGLFIGTNIWREMLDFSDDCVLLVLADAYYDEKEYVRNYEEFQRMVHT